MRVVVQNGANHFLSRREAEAVVESLPTGWTAAVDQLVLARGQRIEAKLYGKKRLLYLFSPPGPSTPCAKRLAVEVLLESLSALANEDLTEELLRLCSAKLHTEC